MTIGKPARCKLAATPPPTNRLLASLPLSQTASVTAIQRDDQRSVFGSMFSVHADNAGRCGNQVDGSRSGCAQAGRLKEHDQPLAYAGTGPDHRRLGEHKRHRRPVAQHRQEIPRIDLPSRRCGSCRDGQQQQRDQQSARAHAGGGGKGQPPTAATFPASTNDSPAPTVNDTVYQATTRARRSPCRR